MRYAAMGAEASFHLFQADRFFLAPFGHDGQIVKVLEEPPVLRKGDDYRFLSSLPIYKEVPCSRPH
jgi:hypothetical protein